MSADRTAAAPREVSYMVLVPIRGGDPPTRLLLVREGVNTLTDEALFQSGERAHQHLGFGASRCSRCRMAVTKSSLGCAPCSGRVVDSCVLMGMSWYQQASGCSRPWTTRIGRS